MDQSNLILFGGTGTLGNKFVRMQKRKNFRVIEIGKKQHGENSKHIFANYESYIDIEEALRDIQISNDTAIVFAHRARDNSKKRIQKSFYKTIQAELNPYIAIYEFINERVNKEQPNINIVSITSTSSQKGAYDVPFDYHVIKAAQRAAARSLVYCKKGNIFSNIVRFGEALDHRRDVHSEFCSSLFSNAEEILRGKQLPSFAQISSVVLMLCEANRYAINGQVLTVDSGLGLLSNEFILREHSRK